MNKNVPLSTSVDLLFSKLFT